MQTVKLIVRQYQPRMRADGTVLWYDRLVQTIYCESEDDARIAAEAFCKSTDAESARLLAFGLVVKKDLHLG